MSAIRRSLELFPRTVGCSVVAIAASAVLLAVGVPAVEWLLLAPVLALLVIGAVPADGTEAGLLSEQAAEVIVSVPLALVVIGFVVLLLDGIGGTR